MAKRIRVQVVVSMYGIRGGVDKQLPTFDLDCDMHGITTDKKIGQFVSLSNAAYRLVLDLIDPFRVVDDLDVTAMVLE